MQRLALIAGAVAALVTVWFGSSWIERAVFVDAFEFTALKEPAGFRRISSGEFSAGWTPLAGVGGADEPAVGERAPPEGRRLCRALFGETPVPADVVPIAYFSDYRCPYCRVLSRQLAEIEEDLPASVRIAWHEWPIFGESSELAARAALAARRQGAYADFHKRLMETSFVPTPAYLTSISQQIGVEAERLLHDMTNADVERQLDESRSLAKLFGFPGTPGLIVGRTVVIGAISDAQLRALIDREAADGPSEPCRSDGAHGY